MVTAFVNAYYEKTGVPVVAISASRGSSSLNGWLNSGRKEEAADRLNAAKECLKKEKIRAASHLHGLVPGRGGRESGDARG